MDRGMQTKALSIRLPIEQANALELLAYFDRCSVAEEIRQAITDHIQARRGDQQYLEQMRQELERARQRIEQFVGKPPDDPSLRRTG